MVLLHHTELGFTLWKLRLLLLGSLVQYLLRWSRVFGSLTGGSSVVFLSSTVSSLALPPPALSVLCSPYNYVVLFYVIITCDGVDWWSNLKPSASGSCSSPSYKHKHKVHQNVLGTLSTTHPVISLVHEQAWVGAHCISRCILRHDGELKHFIVKRTKQVRAVPCILCTALLTFKQLRSIFLLPGRKITRFLLYTLIAQSILGNLGQVTF